MTPLSEGARHAAGLLGQTSGLSSHRARDPLNPAFLLELVATAHAIPSRQGLLHVKDAHAQALGPSLHDAAGAHSVSDILEPLSHVGLRPRDHLLGGNAVTDNLEGGGKLGASASDLSGQLFR